MGSMSRASDSRDRIGYASLAARSRRPFSWGMVRRIYPRKPSGKGYSIGRKSQLLWHSTEWLGSGDGGRGLCTEHLKRVCAANHNATWVLMNLGRWRPREAAQQTNVKGVEVQTPDSGVCGT